MAAEEHGHFKAKEFFEGVASCGLQRLLEERGGLVQVLDCFPEATALEALRALEGLAGQEWKLSTNRAAQDAQHRFWRYEGRAADVVLQPLLALAPEMHPEVHAAKYEGGGHIALHNDARCRPVEAHELDRFSSSFPAGSIIQRRVALIYYLTKDWREDYGGCFVDHGGGKRRVVVPRFNSLIAFLVPRDHEVMEVQPGAPLRFTLFGWFSDLAPADAGSGPGRTNVRVTVPDGAKPGDVVGFLGPDRRPRNTQVPPGFEPGQDFIVPLGPLTEPWVVTVPPGCQAGDPVRFPGPGGFPLTAPVPQGLQPGGRFEVMVPIPQPFMAVVPEGKQEGADFTFTDADGVEQRAVVPAGASAGETVRVMVCPPLWTDLEVAIPKDLSVGKTFSFFGLHGTALQAVVPEAKRGRDTMTVRIPLGA